MGMASRLEYSLRCDTYGAGTTAPSGSVSSAVGWTEQAYVGLLAPTGLAATDVFTLANHGLLSGDAVFFTALTGGANLVLGTTYYVINPTATTFQLSSTLGGASFNFTTDVTASTLVGPSTTVTHTLYMTPNRFGETWDVERVTVQNTSPLKVPTASVYRGVLNPSALVDVTQNGTNDVDDLLSPITLNRGETIIIQFTGCQPPAYTGVMSSTVFLGGTVYYG